MLRVAPRSLGRAAVALAVVAAGLTGASPSHAVVDPGLVAGLDGVVALSPPDSCLRVDLGRATIYEHQVDVALIPASTQKLLVGQVALDTLGSDHRFRTAVVGTAPVDGVVVGDITLVGGGDPLLSTAADAFVRRTADQPVTFLDELADRLVAAGVTRVVGGVVGDESRYDRARTVDSWPERYLSQRQIGPLSALTVDDGYRLTLTDGEGEPQHHRSADPATDAAATFIDLLRARGVVVDGGPSSGLAPADLAELAHIESAPLSAVVRQLLEESDNGTAELLTKEMGVESGNGGSTGAGTAYIRNRAVELGLPVDGTLLADGSGLARANRTTCDALVELLGQSGPEGELASSLPVAGRTGTLRTRFRGTPAEGRLRAKTGSLNDVTALAGFVEMPDGQVATFAYIANGPQADDPRRGQDFLGALLGQYERVCPEETPRAVVAPVGTYALGAVALAPVGVAPLIAPAMIVALDSFEMHPDGFVDSCLLDDPSFTLRLPT